MLQPWVTGIITDVLDETPTTKRFFITVPGTENFEFIPGQFITIDLPIHEQKNKRWRSYSIASPPNGTNQFELVVVKLEGGAGSAWFWQFGVPGVQIQFRGPQGRFVLPDTIEEDLYLICTGTGVAPFRSMIHHIYTNQVPHKNIYLIFGCRRFGDTLYFNEFKTKEQQLEHFHYMPTFSREPADNHLLMRTGYVHAVYEEYIRQNSMHDESGNGRKLKPAMFYICGWKEMIDDARQKLLAMGYDKKNIQVELYG